MHEDEDDPDVAGHPLPGVAPVVLVAVAPDVDAAGPREDEPQERVEGDGQPQEPDLDEHESGQGVDEAHLVQEGLDAGVRGVAGGCQGVGLPRREVARVEPATPDDRGVRGQVGNEEGPDREDARERVQPAEQEVMAVEECSFGHGAEV